MPDTTEQVLRAGPPLEAPRHEVGHASALLVDADRGDRLVGVDCWYPAEPGAPGDLPAATYSVIPGVGFTASARTNAPAAADPRPLVVLSHGRSGLRTSYVMLCEGLAARGFVVAALDHPGDTLLDWMTGTAVDDATNEVQRVADVQFVIDALLGDPTHLPPLAAVDPNRVAVVGHSYGGFTALAVAAVEPPDPRIRGVAGLQPFARSLRRSAIARIAVPTLLIVGAHDQTCPPDTDADRVTGTVTRDDARRIDLAAAGHQACSDVGLYLELESRVEGLPDIVAAFLASMADQVTGRAGEPWRPTVGLHLRILGAWLDDVLGTDPDAAARELAAIAELPGVTSR
jgi:predicted dienelactone hydrolase